MVAMVRHIAEALDQFGADELASDPIWMCNQYCLPAETEHGPGAFSLETTGLDSRK